MKLFHFFKTRKLNFTLMSITFVVLLVGFVMYFVSQSMMGAKIELPIIFASVIGLVLNLYVLIVDDYESYIEILVSALAFVSMGLFLSSQLGNLGYYFAGIADIGYGIMPTFVAGIILDLVGVVTTSISVFTKTENK
ncbi:MAG: hypothetical protein WCR56_04295 [Bacilli bacterium]